MNPKEHETLKIPSLQPFQPTIAKISIAQICKSIGFTGSQTLALEAFSNIATRYIETLAKSACLSANSCGRTKCNLFDVISALEELNLGQGFKGAGNVNQSLMKSGVLKEIMRFVRVIDEIPFAKPIPRRDLRERSDFSLVRGERFPHIPPWAPSFPDPSTYKKVEKDREGVVVAVESCVSNVGQNVNVEKKKESYLPVKRPKVKFKFGKVDSATLGVNVELDMRNGVCRGGKRVSWHNVGGEDGVKRGKSLKRKRR